MILVVCYIMECDCAMIVAREIACCIAFCRRDGVDGFEWKCGVVGLFACCCDLFVCECVQMRVCNLSKRIV